MSRYIDASCRKCRALNTKLFLKGSRCSSGKCAIERGKMGPGQHGIDQKFRKDSDYELHLKEKQRLRLAYGLAERQFRSYFALANSQKAIPTGGKLLELLERRLDNVVFRMGIQPGRKSARQMVCHGNVFVNGHRVDIPSYQVRMGDVVTLTDTGKSMISVQESVASKPATPQWLSFSPDKFEGTVLTIPTAEQIGIPINTRLVIEYYSK
jgi:small subunit ribosomal protein S4